MSIFLHESRNKWKTTQGDAIPGQLVVIKEDNQPPRKVKLALITRVHPGKDERVRVVTVRTAQGEFQGTVVKLVPLFVAPLGQRGRHVWTNKKKTMRLKLWR